MCNSRWCSTLAAVSATLSFGSGCTLDSAEVLRQIDAVHAQKQSGDLVQMLTSVGRFHELADRVDERSEDVITQAYMKAETDDQRRSVVRIAAQNADGSGRYVPLLCYVIQFESDPDLRMAAARGFADMKSLNPIIRRSPIVLMLGEAADGEQTPHGQERLLYFLEEFLLNACHYPIPGAERIESRMPLDASGRSTWRVMRSEPEVVLEWWRASGRAMALAMTFDQVTIVSPAPETTK